jgi:hypothetical protein
MTASSDLNSPKRCLRSVGLEVRPWDWTTRGMLLWYGDCFGVTIAHGRDFCAQGFEPSVIRDESRSCYAFR